MHQLRRQKFYFYLVPAILFATIGFAFVVWQNHDISVQLLAIDPVGGALVAQRFTEQNWFITIVFTLCVSIFIYLFYRLHRSQILDIFRKDDQLERGARELEFQLAKRTLDLMSTEAKLKAIIESTPVVLWTTDIDLRFTVSQGSGLKGLGLQPNEVVGRTIADVYGSQPEIIDHHIQALRGLSHTAKFKVGPKTYACQLSPLCDADGNTTGVIGVALDISEMERTAEQLQQHEKQLMELVEYLPDGIAVSVDGIVVYINPAGAKMFGGVPSDANGKSLLDFVHPDIRSVVGERLQRLAMGQNVPLMPVRLLRLDGSHFDAEVKSRTFLFGKNFGVLTSLSDVTQKRQTEEAMRRSNVMLKALVGNSPLALVSLNQSGLVQTWNNAAERLFGWRSKDVLGQPCPIIPDDMRVEMNGTIKRLLAGQPTAPFTMNMRKHDGSLQLCQIIPATLREENGEIAGCFAYLLPADRI